MVENGNKGDEAPPMAPPPRPPLMRLRCSVQNYEWGRRGEDSSVGRLFARNSSAEVDPARPYAEFWMGTHGSGPSFLLLRSGAALVSLKEWILQNPSVLGEKVAARWAGDLPFLFKVPPHFFPFSAKFGVLLSFFHLLLVNVGFMVSRGRVCICVFVCSG